MKLTYEFERNVSREAGAISFWARTSFSATAPRGVFVADEVPPAGEGKQASTGMSFWVERLQLVQVEGKILGRYRIGRHGGGAGHG